LSGPEPKRRERKKEKSPAVWSSSSTYTVHGAPRKGRKSPRLDIRIDPSGSRWSSFQERGKKGGKGKEGSGEELEWERLASSIPLSRSSVHREEKEGRKNMQTSIRRDSSPSF